MKVCFFFDQVNEKGPYYNYLKLHFVKMNGKVNLCEDLGPAAWWALSLPPGHSQKA
jgi:hypothetical protein